MRVKMSEDKVQTSANEDEYIGVETGIVFLEKLLLSIIDAHPVGSETRRQRLSTAIRALTGEEVSKNPLTDDLDFKALCFMGGELHRDKVLLVQHKIKNYRNINPSPEPKIRSDSALANAAVEKYFHKVELHAKSTAVNRLREKFSGSYDRKQGKDRNIDYRDTYVFMATEYDYLADSLEQQGLISICAELRRFGVKTSVCDESFDISS